MVWRCLVSTLLLTCCATRCLAVEFPYEAYINSADVYVRSGPGRDYYPTDKLQKGEKVEIYRHDPGGWYAIRPPRRSFSWVSSRHLDAVGNDLAMSNTERAVARVGSAFSDVRDVIQVRLEKGEKVELLTPASPDSPWCKISPPAGEFRWVFAKFVDRELPDELARDEREARGEDPDAADNSPSQVQLATSMQPVGARRDSASKAAGPATVDRELDRIDLQISATVVEEVSAWSFGDLKQRTEAVLAQAQTPTERGRATMMLDKLARFEDIKMRHDALRRGEALAGSPQPGAPVDVSRFDGIGRLAPVISQRSGAPQFALVDGSNSVISFVTAAPGVNLRPYVDKHVGVNGQRGYMTDLGRQHINVQRVTVLDVQRR
jgi:SH3-like domain-containing protein